MERPLSAGGMGSVYVVTQLNTQRQRALKVMHPELAQHPKFQERFRQEAQVGAQIHSDHIVEVVDAGVDAQTGMPYLAMELLDGLDLADTVEQRGPLPPEEVATIYEQLCHALSAAHRANIVHRDLKPENLFLARSRRADSDWTLKILDFGIAKMVAEAHTASRATQSIGSPLWMAPEQTVTGGVITPATDIWALGLIGFYLLTARSHWRAANEETVQQMRLLREIAFEPLSLASQRATELGVSHLLPAGFDSWFARCVAREPRARFDKAEHVLRELLPLLRAGRAQRLSAPGSHPHAAGLHAASPPHVAAIAHASAGAHIPTDHFAPGLAEPTTPAPAIPVTQVDGPYAPATPQAGLTAPGTPATAPGSQAAAPGSGHPAMQPSPAQPTEGSGTGFVVAERHRPPKLALVIMLLTVTGLAVGAFLVVASGDDDSDSTATIFEVSPSAVEPTEPVASSETKPDALEPDAVEPDDATASDPGIDPSPQPSATAQPRAFTPPNPRAWPKPRSTQRTAAPNPPPPRPVTRPPSRSPRPRPPPTTYGRPCRTSSQCGSGYECSYGGKCVRSGRGR